MTLKAYGSGASLVGIATALLASTIAGFVMWELRKKVVRAIHELSEAIFDGPNLLPLAVIAMVLLYSVLLLGTSALNAVLVVGVLIVHLLNIHLQPSFYRGSIAILFIGLLFQVVAVSFRVSIIAITVLFSCLIYLFLV